MFMYSWAGWGWGVASGFFKNNFIISSHHLGHAILMLNTIGFHFV
jgi:hypothetical protein